MKREVSELIARIKKHRLCKKNLYETCWTSGCQTVVHPITVDENKITLQWKSNTKCPAFMAEVFAFNDIVKNVIFNKSDGSCPATIVVYYKVGGD